jgi:hypothetical protein
VSICVLGIWDKEVLLGQPQLRVVSALDSPSTVARRRLAGHHAQGWRGLADLDDSDISAPFLFFSGQQQQKHSQAGGQGAAVQML